MQRIRWSFHSLQNLAARDIDQAVAEHTIRDPEFAVPDPPDREIRMRRYFDQSLHQEMLLRVVIEETDDEIVIVTLYKTSQIDRYLKGQTP